jgi:hypothetical protein
MSKRRKGAGDGLGSSSPTAAGYSSTKPSNAPGCAQAEQNIVEHLLDITDILVDEGALDLLGLMRLGSCSKACSSATAALLEKRALVLLATAVKQSAVIENTSNKNLRQTSIKAALWLLQGAADGTVNLSALTAQTAAAQFVSIHNVPQELAAALLQAGLQFSYEQLMQAVRARTAGVEVWVTAAAGLPMPMVQAVEAALRASLPSWVLLLCNNPLTLVRSSGRCAGCKTGVCVVVAAVRCIT